MASAGILLRLCSPLSSSERVQWQHRDGHVFRCPSGNGCNADKVELDRLISLNFGWGLQNHLPWCCQRGSCRRITQLHRQFYFTVYADVSMPPPAVVRAKFQGEFLDSSVDLGVDRLALLRSWVPGLITLNGVTSQPVFSDAANHDLLPGWQLSVWGTENEAISCARRQWSLKRVIHSRAELCAVRQEQVQYMTRAAIWHACRNMSLRRFWFLQTSMINEKHL